MEALQYQTGFNESEVNAWKSGTGLRTLLEQLKAPPYNYSVDVLAHSQGNVVVAEALREAKDGLEHVTTPPLMNAWVATQAALSSSLFDSNAVDYFTTQGRNWTHVTPVDALAHFPLTNSPFDGSAQPYMAGTKDYARYRMNFYNEGDYAVGDETSFLIGFGTQSAWEVNNKMNRPWQALGADPSYGFNPAPDKRFFFQLTHVAPNQLQEYDLDPSNPDDRFKILAFAAQSYGRALGADPVPSYFDAAAKLGFSPNIDLAADPTFFGQGHYEHDAQFMYAIQQRWHYWQTLLSSLGFTPSPWSTP